MYYLIEMCDLWVDWLISKKFAAYSCINQSVKAVYYVFDNFSPSTTDSLLCILGFSRKCQTEWSKLNHSIPYNSHKSKPMSDMNCLWIPTDFFNWLTMIHLVTRSLFTAKWCVQVCTSVLFLLITTVFSIGLPVQKWARQCNYTFPRRSWTHQRIFEIVEVNPLPVLR